MKYKITKEELELVVKKSLSISDICRQLNIRPVGGNYKTIKSKLKEFDINTDHFTGGAWNQGNRFRPFGSNKRELSEILIKNSPHKTSHHLRLRLIKEGLKDNKCEECGITDWNGKPISLELEHVNGDNTDNRLENLKILCPNCHSQTPFFRGKNKISILSEKRKI